MSEKIAVIGLGYVGLPLAVALARRHDVVAFDISSERIDALRQGIDSTNEVAAEDLKEDRLRLANDQEYLKDRDIFIVTVPTPIDEANRPDFRAILSACEIVGTALSKGSIVVFESTVYPGATEEICGPALEKASGLRSGVDFKLGYSPERINPSDKEHPLEKIVKVAAPASEFSASRSRKMSRTSGTRRSSTSTSSFLSSESRGSSTIRRPMSARCLRTIG